MRFVLISSFYYLNYLIRASNDTIVTLYTCLYLRYFAASCMWSQPPNNHSSSQMEIIINAANILSYPSDPSLPIVPHHSNHSFSLPHDVCTATRALSIEPQFIRYVCFPKCFYRHSLEEFVEVCTWRETPWSKPCEEKLWILRSRITKLSLHSMTVLLLLYFSPAKLSSRLLSSTDPSQILAPGIVRPPNLHTLRLHSRVIYSMAPCIPPHQSSLRWNVKAEFLLRSRKLAGSSAVSKIHHLIGALKPTRKRMNPHIAGWIVC